MFFTLKLGGGGGGCNQVGHTSIYTEKYKEEHFLILHPRLRFPWKSVIFTQFLMSDH